jgi:cytochrome P450
MLLDYKEYRDSEHPLRMECFELLFGGSEALVHNATQVLYFVMKHTEVRDKARQELQAAGVTGGKAWENTKLPALPYLVG